MKNLKIVNRLLFGFLAMFMFSLTVYANDSEFITCLKGKENTCTLNSENENMGETFIEIKDNRNLTIDLQGHSFKLNHSLKIMNNSKVTIQNGTIDASEINGGNALIVDAGGELVIDKVTINGRNGAHSDGKNYQLIFVSSKEGTTKLDIKNNVNITSYNDAIGVGEDGQGNSIIDMAGTITTDMNSISVNGTLKTDQKNIVINIKNGANVTSKTGTAIYAAGTSTINVEGGTLSGEIGIVSRQGIINVTNGTINGNSNGKETNVIGDNNTNLTNGAAIVVDNETPGYGKEGKTANVKISGGILESNIAKVVVSHGDEENAEDFTITGGQFNKEVQKEFVKNSEAEVKIGDKYYIGDDAEEAVQSASSGTTVEVLTGNLTVENVPGGVTVKNNSDGAVTVNGENVEKNKDITTQASTPSTPSDEEDKKTEEKQVTGVDSVVFEDNGAGIEVEGKVITETEKDETYDEMVKYAADKGYTEGLKMFEFHIKDEKTLNGKLKLTFDLGEENNTKIAYVLHKKHDNSYEEFEVEVKNGKIQIEVAELSPFIVALKDKEVKDEVVNNPQTSSLNIVAYELVTVASLAGLIALVKKNKKNA